MPSGQLEHLEAKNIPYEYGCLSFFYWWKLWASSGLCALISLLLDFLPQGPLGNQMRVF